MRKFLSLSLFLLVFLLLSFLPTVVKAQEVFEVDVVAQREVELSEVGGASESGITVEKTFQGKGTSEKDLTTPKESKSRLERVLESQEIKNVWPANFLKVAIRKAVAGGVGANMFVLILLFPLTAALVAFSRNILGVKGFGIFIPAVVSVAFLSTGVVVGVVLFMAILLAATLARKMLKKIRMQYYPRMAMLVWVVSMTVFGLLLLAPTLGIADLQQVGIFPILLFILLADPFIDAQIHRSMRTAMVMAVETIVLALIAFLVMQSVWVQDVVLLNPEVSVLAVLLINGLISRYKGLRLLEVWRFRKLLEK